MILQRRCFEEVSGLHFLLVLSSDPGGRQEEKCELEGSL